MIDSAHTAPQCQLHRHLHAALDFKIDGIKVGAIARARTMTAMNHPTKAHTGRILVQSSVWVVFFATRLERDCKPLDVKTCVHGSSISMITELVAQLDAH